MSGQEGLSQKATIIAPSGANKTLYELRRSHGLGLFEAAHAMRVPAFLLYLFERGYIALTKKSLAKAASFYSVDPAVFFDPLAYPSPIEKEKVKKESKAKKFIFSWRGVLLSLLLCFLSWGVFGGGIGLAIYSRTNAVSFYDNPYLSFCTCLAEKGTASEPDDDGTVTYSYTFKDANDNDLVASVMDDAHQIGELKFSLSFTSEDEHDVLLTFIQRSNELSFNFDDIHFVLENLSVVMGRGYITADGVYKVGRVIFGTALTGDGDGNSTEALEKRFAEYAAIIDLDYQGLATAIGYSGGESFRGMLALQGKGHSEQLKYSTSGDAMILAGSILGSAFLFSTVLLFIVSYHEKKKRKLLALQENPVPSAPFEEVKPLKKNWVVFPFLPESVLRIVSLVLILVSSILLFNIVMTLFASGPLDITKAIEVFTSGKKFLEVQTYVLAATLLWFFIRIEIMNKQGNAIITAIMFLFFGVLYYIGIDMLTFFLKDTNDTYRSMLITILPLVLPGNVFWGLAAFSFIVLFLGTIPEGSSPLKRVLWHGLAIFPIGYLVLSYFYQVGTKIWNWPTWPDWAANLLFRKQFAATVFAIVYPLGVTIYRYIVRKKYGLEQSKLYFEGNKYYFIKNLIAASIIAIIAGTAFAFKNSDSSLAGTLDLKKAPYVAYLIPLVLFYHPHVGKRNTGIDLAFSLFYSLSFALGYVYLGQFILFFA